MTTRTTSPAKSPTTTGKAAVKTAPKASPEAASSPTAAALTRATAPGTPASPTGAAARVELKKKELIDAVVARTGIRKKFAKPAVEAMIDILGEAIGEGREVNLQPLGKIISRRTRDTANARVTVARIRQSKAASPALDPADRSDMDKSEPTVADLAE